MQNEDLSALSDAELLQRIETTKARVDLMEAQLEDIRDEGREDSPVYERIEDRRLKLDVEAQRLAAEAQRRPGILDPESTA